MTNSREQGPDATASWQPGQPVVPGVTRRRFLLHRARHRRRGGAPASSPGGGRRHGRRAAAAGALPKGWTGTIADVKHVVILMQENRSFDHYFGTLSGVRGFADKQALTYQNGTSVFQQPDPSRTDLGYLLPYNLTDQTDGDLDHWWDGDHEARNGGLWNNWVAAKSRRDDGLLHQGRDPVPVRRGRRLHHLRRLPPGDHGRRPAPTGCTSGPARRPAGPATRTTTRSTSAPTPARPRSPPTPSCCRRPGSTGRCTPTTRSATAAATPTSSSATTATTRSGSTSSTTPATAATAGPASSRTAARSRRGRPTPGAPPLSQTHAAYVLSSFINDVKNNTLPAGVVDRRPGRLLRAPLLHPRLRRPLRQHGAADADVQPRAVEEHGAVHHLRRARRVLRPPAPAVPRDDRHRRVHRRAADRPRHPGPDADLLAVDPRRLRRLQRLQPHLDARVPGRPGPG